MKRASFPALPHTCEPVLCPHTHEPVSRPAHPPESGLTPSPAPEDPSDVAPCAPRPPARGGGETSLRPPRPRLPAHGGPPPPVPPCLLRHRQDPGVQMWTERLPSLPAWGSQSRGADTHSIKWLPAPEGERLLKTSSGFKGPPQTPAPPHLAPRPEPRRQGCSGRGGGCTLGSEGTATLANYSLTLQLSLRPVAPRGEGSGRGGTKEAAPLGPDFLCGRLPPF